MWLKHFCLVLCAELKRRRQRAQDSGDISEEAKICNAIGDLYLQCSMSNKVISCYITLVEKNVIQYKPTYHIWKLALNCTFLVYKLLVHSKKVCATCVLATDTP